MQVNLSFAHTYENFGEVDNADEETLLDIFKLKTAKIKDPEFCQEFMPNYEMIIKVCEKSIPFNQKNEMIH